jgi:hypothetical protein
MRDYSTDYFDWDDSASARLGTSGAGSWNSLQTIALVGAIALIATPVVRALLERRRSSQFAALEEPAVDKTLKDTYPASDPPASRYFGIPENRR